MGDTKFIKCQKYKKMLTVVLCQLTVMINFHMDNKCRHLKFPSDRIPGRGLDYAENFLSGFLL